MMLKLQDYECPYCLLPSYGSIVTSCYYGGDDVYSNGCPPFRDSNLAYLLCPFCKSIFLRSIGSEMPQSISFRVAKNVTDTLKNEKFSDDKNMQMFFDHYGNTEFLQKYSQLIIDCFPEKYIKKAILNGNLNIVYNDHQSAFLRRIRKYYALYQLSIKIKDFLRGTGNKPSKYSYKEGSFFEKVNDVLKKKRLSVSVISHDIECHLTAFRTCKKEDPLRKTILLHFIWDVEDDGTTSEQLSHCKLEYELALQELVKYLENNKDLSEYQNLLLAEFYRRLERFDDALIILNIREFADEHNQVMARLIAEHAQNKDSKVFKFDPYKYSKEVDLNEDDYHENEDFGPAFISS